MDSTVLDYGDQFRERTVIVTGGGYGIGREIALAFGRRGANVVLAARSTQRMEAVAETLRQAGTQPLVVTLDVASEAACRDMVARTLETYGAVDVLVNNSGIAGPTALARDAEGDAWRETIDVNLSGAFYCAKYVSGPMIERKRGNIVNISSIAGRIGFAMRTPYAASKWGMIGLSHSLAAELGPYGIRVNALCPGPMQGERYESILSARSEATGRSRDDLLEEIEADIPLRRRPAEAEVAEATVWLASDAAFSVSGQCFNIDGGYRMQ